MDIPGTASDWLTRPLDPAMTAPCADARALVGLLDIDSYAKMGPADAERQARLAELEPLLARPAVLVKDRPWGAADRRAAYAFAQAFRRSALYPDTVGAHGDIIATLATPTFSCVRPATPDAARHTAAFHRLCARLGHVHRQIFRA